MTNISSFYETQPVGFPYQGWFYNVAIRGDFQGDPLELLDLLKRMEREFSNIKKFQYGPRILDADILTFGDISIDTPELTIPHPKLESRRFALVPIAEIFPDFVHPVSGLSVSEMLSRCMDDSTVLIFPSHGDINWQIEVSR